MELLPVYPSDVILVQSTFLLFAKYFASSECKICSSNNNLSFTLQAKYINGDIKYTTLTTFTYFFIHIEPVFKQIIYNDALTGF